MSGERPPRGEALLERWPPGRPVGLLALTGEDEAASLEERSFARDASVRCWWSAKAENMFVGPSQHAPFQRMRLLEVADARSARRLVDGLRTEFGGAVLAASPLPSRAKRMLRAVQFALRRLPAPRAALEPFSDAPLGAAMPSPQQLDRFRKLPQDRPVLVLNLNRYAERARHPRTGELAPGREIAQVYYRRGMLTYARLGARMIWAGECRGQVAGELEIGDWETLGLVLYPSRAAFEHMARVPAFHAAMPFRDAGLESSWVVQCRVTASSFEEDVA